MDQQNEQQVVSVTDRVLGAQVWYNAERGRKPQSFTQEPTLADPTDNGRTCDFCQWRTLTAIDIFGRIERTHAVSASNLFKYCQPFHGLILFKHHHPLQFNLLQLSDLLLVAQEWFERGSATQPSARHPFLLWNCGPRAGASQFHGHAQVALSQVPFPGCEALTAAAERYPAALPGADYYGDLIRAHRAAGLLHEHAVGDKRAWCYASLVPTKDMELVVQGSGLSCPCFQYLLHAALRALIDRLGVATFNVGIFNIRYGADVKSSAPHLAASVQAVDGSGAPQPPILARIVSRGKTSSRASDYGGLEVFGKASIGNTDPYRVFAALQAQLQATLN
ncbi:hypothetical protein COCSUDRAFT_63282 [Coccomyxa subellipsoidea C-169]|uniref:ATP adenylyltransferase n=1 Tax=Coccomyxa subellipsoidea (strain C-169) TaxID=574566 RepID=I0YZD8_COCSC|nr:hypothetical protein COCSUDRAFT_63282 [Coccomyxa subellipsoidea C-169]EIE23757.1 hypothetical protein COCSUDRAFT_63282 [Coccomyxa subellipsoidea C-169]|eukprot:XP_005648301.1 hypothetical protein COCSUDRAFT_63282 [Coccomyxa subellipsoidea C-169]